MYRLSCSRVRWCDSILVAHQILLLRVVKHRDSRKVNRHGDTAELATGISSADIRATWLTLRVRNHRQGHGRLGARVMVVELANERVKTDVLGFHSFVECPRADFVPS